MPIDGITMPKAGWNGALDAPNALDGVKSAKGDGAIRITHADGKGAVTSVTIERPKLDAPAAYSVAALEDLVAGLSASSPFPGTPAERKRMLDLLKGKVDEVAKEHPEIVADAVSEPGPQRGASRALFEVFAILKLMLIVAQKARNALREQRQADNAAVQKAIKDQAEGLEAAAWAGVGAALGAGVLQGVLLGVQAYRFSSSVDTKMNLQDASATSAAKTNLNTAKLTADGAKAKANLKSLGDKLGEGQGKFTIDNSLTKNTTVNGVEFKCDDKLRAIETAAQKVNPEVQPGQPEVQAGQQAGDKSPQEQLEDARKDYCDEIDKVESEYREQYEAARVEYKNALKSGDKSRIKEAKLNLEAAASRYEYAHAAAIELKIEHGGMSRADVAKASVQRDGRAVDAAYGDLRFDDEYMALDNHFEWLRIGNSLIQVVGQMLGSAVSQGSQLISAKAHKYGAVEQEARNELDQINDLFNNCQKLLETVLQVILAVIQAESQSVDSTIQGLRG